MRWVKAGILINATALGILGACGGRTDLPTSCDPSECNAAASSGSSGTGFAGSAGAFGAGAGGSGKAGVSGSGPTDGGRPDARCASITSSSEVVVRDVDLFILLDRSSAMAQSDNRWALVTSALDDFLQSPVAVGLGVGIGYFGLHPPGTMPIDPLSPGSCNPYDYSRPDVPIDVLPAARQAISDSLARQTPGGAAPIGPALLGAIQYAIQRRLTQPLRKTLVVLIAGGEPQGCMGDDLTTLSQVAAAGAGANPQILTHVIGVGNVRTLDPVARAGGTGGAYVVQSADDIAIALNKISRLAERCRLQLPLSFPAGIDVDFGFDKVNVYVEPEGREKTLIHHVGRSDGCRADSGGWFFDRSFGAAPTTLLLCPATCRSLTGSSRVKIEIGCPTVDAPQ